MELIGWNVVPDECVAEVHFELAPKWIQILALTPCFERFAYPIAVRRGFGTLWIDSSSKFERDFVRQLGWKIREDSKTDLEKFLDGSLSFLSEREPYRRVPIFSLSQWGRQRARIRQVHKMNGTYESYKNGVFPTA